MSLDIVNTVTDTEGTAWATFDCTRSYRYALGRRWAPGPVLAAIMLNPSVADAFVLDPTMRRLESFARREHCGAMVAVNLFALRSTDPRSLYRHDDPVGPDNDRFLLRHAQPAQTVLAAWGIHGAFGGRAVAVEQLLFEAGIHTWCLGTTRAGFPRHPLYVQGSTPLVAYPQGME